MNGPIDRATARHIKNVFFIWLVRHDIRMSSGRATGRPVHCVHAACIDTPDDGRNGAKMKMAKCDPFISDGIHFKIECACKCDVPVYDITTNGQNHHLMLLSVSCMVHTRRVRLLPLLLLCTIIAIACIFSVVIHMDVNAGGRGTAPA